jgi:hypothetical protein
MGGVADGPVSDFEAFRLSQYTPKTPGRESTTETQPLIT